MNHIREITIISGNVLNKTLTIQKGNDAAAEELYQTLKSCIETPKDVNDFRKGSSFEIRTEEENGGAATGEERSGLKVSLKLFLYADETEDINNAIDHGLNQCSVEFLDTLVLSFPGQSESSRLTLERIQKTWTILEENVDKNRVKMIGICDLDPQLFIQLYNWAKVKPSIVQINLTSCCVVPPELSAFCKENGVQLLTHSDPMDILGAEKLTDLMKSLESHLYKDEENLKRFKCEPKWIVRYQIHLKTRGVLASKGYAACLLLM